MRVADGELDADQPARDQAAQELGPERLGLGLADVDARGSRAARSRARHARSPAPCDHAAAVADLLDLGVEEQVRVAALQRPRPERLDVLIQRRADPADLALGDPQPEALDQLIDPPGRDAADVGLLDDGQQRLLRALAAAPRSSGSSCPGGSSGSATRSHPPACPNAAADTRCDASPGPPAGARRARRRSTQTPRAPSSPRATALTASRITSACSSSSTFLTTSSIVILSAPATRRLLSSNPEEVRRS